MSLSLWINTWLNCCFCCWPQSGSVHCCRTFFANSGVRPNYLLLYLRDHTRHTSIINNIDRVPKTEPDRHIELRLGRLKSQQQGCTSKSHKFIIGTTELLFVWIILGFLWFPTARLLKHLSQISEGLKNICGLKLITKLPAANGANSREIRRSNLRKQSSWTAIKVFAVLTK